MYQYGEKMMYNQRNRSLSCDHGLYNAIEQQGLRLCQVRQRIQDETNTKHPNDRMMFYRFHIITFVSAAQFTYNMKNDSTRAAACQAAGTSDGHRTKHTSNDVYLNNVNINNAYINDAYNSLEKPIADSYVKVTFSDLFVSFIRFMHLQSFPDCCCCHTSYVGTVHDCGIV